LIVLFSLIVMVNDNIVSDADKIDWGNLNAEKSYSPTNNYSISKLANIWFTKELAQRLEGIFMQIHY